MAFTKRLQHKARLALKEATVRAFQKIFDRYNYVSMWLFFPLVKNVHQMIGMKKAPLILRLKGLAYCVLEKLKS